MARNGEHTHPDIDGMLRALVADVARLNANVARLTAQIVALEANNATKGNDAPPSG